MIARRGGLPLEVATAAGDLFAVLPGGPDATMAR